VAHRRPDVRIVAFEPHPLAVDSWRRNHHQSASDLVTLEAAAVTDQAGVVRIDAPQTDLGAGVVGRNGTGVEVAAITLDAYCASRNVARIDVMKVDVEGSEAEVLDGARHLLTSGAIRSLILEFNDGHLARRGRSRREMVEWLAQHGMIARGPLDADDVAFAASA
jgi:FkbM family methyltransferase